MSPGPETAPRRHRAAWGWLVAAFGCLGLAIATSAIPVSRDTYRYLFVLDITQSMNVPDMGPDTAAMSRIGFAKSAVESALKQLPCGSEAGLAIFTAHRTFVMFTPVEICEHFSALSEMLREIDWRMAWAARSEVAKGLYSALDAVQRVGDDTRLVFLTDGHEAPPVNVDLKPRFRDEPGSVAGLIGGIGALVPSRIPHLDDEGNIVGYWSHQEVMQIDVYSLGRAATQEGEAMVGVDLGNVARRIALGQEHLSSLREAYLQELASLTGLDYARVDSIPAFVQHLRQDQYARRTPVATDLGWIPATFAFLCLLYCFVAMPLRGAMTGRRRGLSASAGSRP